MVILDESTRSGGVGATISAIISEDLYDELDAPVSGVVTVELIIYIRSD